MKFLIALSALLQVCHSFSLNNVKQTSSIKSKLVASSTFDYKTAFPMADENNKDSKDNKKPAVVEKSMWEQVQEVLSEDAAKDPKKRKGPPIYEPGPYPIHLLAASAYIVPIADSFDLGKYMFEAYPDVLGAYNTLFGPIASIYNGVPFLPFAVFFLMSYICRAPTFSTEVRFHFSQAFMLSIIQFIPSLGLGLLEKGGVPGLGVVYNTVFLWIMISSLSMQFLLLNPLASSKNPFLLNVVGFAMKYMNYTPDLIPKK